MTEETSIVNSIAKRVESAGCTRRRRRPKPPRSRKMDGRSVATARTFRDVHNRQGSLAKMLDESFGPLHEANQKLWCDRAYDMLVAVIYEKLVLENSKIAAGDLKTLAEAFRHARQARAAPRPSPAAGGTAKNPAGSTRRAKARPVPPGELRSAVKQVYGMEVTGHDTKKGAAPSSPGAGG